MYLAGFVLVGMNLALTFVMSDFSLAEPPAEPSSGLGELPLAP